MDIFVGRVLLFCLQKLFTMSMRRKDVLLWVIRSVTWACQNCNRTQESINYLLKTYSIWCLALSDQGQKGWALAVLANHEHFWDPTLSTSKWRWGDQGSGGHLLMWKKFTVMELSASFKSWGCCYICALSCCALFLRYLELQPKPLEVEFYNHVPCPPTTCKKKCILYTVSGEKIIQN